MLDPPPSSLYGAALASDTPPRQGRPMPLSVPVLPRETGECNAAVSSPSAVKAKAEEHLDGPGQRKFFVP